MALMCCNVLQRRTLGLKLLTDHPSMSLLWTDWMRHKFTKSRIPEETFQPKPEDHVKYGGDSQQPHKLHLVTRIRSCVGRPYWEKEAIDKLGLQKAHKPVVHKNIASVNNQLKVVKHLIRVQPLKLPYGVPTEEDLSDTYLDSSGQLVIRKKLQPTDIKSIES
ncbi:39S ribosomal protein L30, mitochondrial [Hyla sarda]|uniref:39S ribosomal protein L30, mitochondrial n=1 Tax=Hyla sarda TaxID=327740 RepID=UPI0024C3EFB8|nr:39S ribosomal protein L30, mitochondrial [Hyla sarda]XP_056411935.1 39S ribosomal protein L30, mitochondrial [Hyla sarda]XP_056411936.1 39S ribosomal protein L30, mitochondrial [Hyla sarda]